MRLTTPEFGLQVASPHLHGLKTHFGLYRDWRCYSEGYSRGDETPWEMRNVEFIEPLKAIAPSGLVRPRDMTDDWYVSAGASSKWRTMKPDWGREALSYAFVDSGTYTVQNAAAGQIASDVGLDGLVPRVGIWLERKPPPIGQGVFVGVMFNVPALYTVGEAEQPARVSLVLPLMQSSEDEGYQWDKPFLHLMLESEIGGGYYVGGGGYSFATDGKLLSYGPQSSAMRFGPGREGWVLEYEEDDELYSGGHILIRNVTDDGGQWWHHHDKNLRLVSTDEAVAAGATWADGAWITQVQGAPTLLNITPIRYGDNAGEAWPRDEKPLPDEDAANDLEEDSFADGASAVFGELATEPANWTVATTAHSDGTQRPEVAFTRATGYSEAYNARPVLWFATEDNPATIGDEDEDAADDTNTEGVHRLVNVRWTWGRNWKRSTGEAIFTPENAAYYTDWRENDDVVLTLGWSDIAEEEGEDWSDLEAAELAHGYILPGGLPRAMDGDVAHGDPQLGPVQFGSFDVARLRQKSIVDVRQAGGMTVGDWAAMVGNALGIADARIYVNPAVADDTIPPHSIPSLPALAPRDGASWESHIGAVEQAADVRCCWNRDLDYDLWVDGGAPEYVPGAYPSGSEIALEIDYQALEEADRILNLSHDATNERFRNFLKARGGSMEEPVEYYYAEDLDDRKAGIGDDWPAHLEAEDAEVAELYAEFVREHYEAGSSRLRWYMPMRPDLRPDMFVQVSNCPGVGLTTNAVYQIEEVTLETATEDRWASTTVTATLVYTPEEAY